jgi:hypothetical protein
MCIRNAYVSVTVNVSAVTSRYYGTRDLSRYARFMTVREISKVTRNKRRLRHIHVKNTMMCCGWLGEGGIVAAVQRILCHVNSFVEMFLRASGLTRNQEVLTSAW